MRYTSALVLMALLVSLQPAQAATFKRLMHGDISTALTSKEFTDEVHWSERFLANGKVVGVSMGRRTAKTWAVRRSELCIIDGAKETCYEVWRESVRLELRRPGEDNLPRQGILRP